MAAVCFYISGHGFGHVSRQIEIINATGALLPDVAIVVRSSAPRWLFERTARVPVTLLAGECDTGAVQIDSLHLDVRATIVRARDFHATLETRAAGEAELLRRHDVRLVIADAPPLGCAAAAAAAVPSVVCSNFTWDWIYEGYADHLAEAPDLLPTIRGAYRQAAAAWRLPMHGGFAPFERIVDLPLVARHATRGRGDVRATLGLPADRPLVLFSFGGYAVNDLDLDRLDCLTRWGVVLTDRDRATAPAGVHAIAEAAIYGAALRYEDLVAACDVVLSKPGYGIISECVANHTALLYTSRGHFVEYDALVAQLPHVLRSRYISHDDLFAGRWRDALDHLLASPPPAASPRTDGAAVVAQLVAATLS